MNSNPIELQICNVSKSYQTSDRQSHQVLSDVSFDIGHNEFICIVGASGCGKSTLLRIIAGLERPDDGYVVHRGEKIQGPSVTRGMVFQEHRLFPWLTVSENIGFGIQKMSSKEKETCIQRQIDLMQLNGFADSFPSQLSGGMAQRVGIARALAANPSVILFDEPFGALDAFTKIQLQEELKMIHKLEHTTMIMITHDIDEAVFLANKVIIMDKNTYNIQKIVEIQLPTSRDRTSENFLYYKKKIYDEFFLARQLVQPEYAI